MTLSYKLVYQEIILVHPTMRQTFAVKPCSTFWIILDLLLSKYAEAIVNRYRLLSCIESLVNKLRPYTLYDF